MYEFIGLYLYIVVIGASNDKFGHQQIQDEKMTIVTNHKTANSALICENKVNCTAQTDAANKYSLRSDVTVTSHSNSIYYHHMFSL